MDDLDLTDLGVVTVTNSTLSLAQDKLRMGKRSTMEERDISKKPRYDNQPPFILRNQSLLNKYEAYTPLVEKKTSNERLENES